MSCVFFPPSLTVQSVNASSLNCPSSVIGPCDTYMCSTQLPIQWHQVEGLQSLGTLEQTLQGLSNQLTIGPAEGFAVPLQPGPLVEFVPALMRRVWLWCCPWACRPPVLLPGGRT